MTEKASVNPIESFVLLAKTAKGAAAVGLIKQVLETPNVYVFGELLDMPNIQECIPYSVLLTELDIQNLRTLEVSNIKKTLKSTQQPDADEHMVSDSRDVVMSDKPSKKSSKMKGLRGSSGTKLWK
ncbi:hypothetical protein KUTeg_002705 [Tegillarca granosa]|uniref:Uncharacterized protein n=1 Tax=Tegillarca granosa TaxID=220873 RepID=A0ABQ9FZJ9_TEGGR|nr:hypothetical protein KUTeg_002705 [Tegillarca granosa]